MMEKDQIAPHQLPAGLFEKPYFMLLESSLGGRYTLAAWEPSKVLIAKDGENFLERLAAEIRKTPAVDSPLPFAGGWIGYLGYELYSEIERKVPDRKPALLPKSVFCFYDKFYLYDHLEKKAHWVGLAPSSSVRGPLKQGAASKPCSNVTHAQYVSAIRDIQKLIAAGDCYQVNLSQRFQATVSKPASEIYQSLRDASPSPYAAFLNVGDTQILSSSPELFLEVDGRRIVTRPIKGTRPRSPVSEEDNRLRRELANSEKDRSELLMITDLERNDLGRVCEAGSIRVSELRTIETYPQVHHLVSTIEGTLKNGCDVIDLLRATFPGGSITGAPKVRAMQIIRDLEPHAREVYCGAIGYISANGKAQFNVAIRTMVVKENTATFWAGGGIVADSDPEKEYEETLVKAAGLRKSLGV